MPQQQIMRLNLYQTLKKLNSVLVITCFALLTTITANAQHRQRDALTYGGGSNGSPSEDGWGIAFGGGYEVPTGDMAASFKGAPVFHISAVHNLGDFTFTATIGYASFKPKQDTSFVYVDNEQVGYIKYGNYSSLQIYAGVAYNIAIADQAKLYIGADFGSYYNFLSVSAGSTDPSSGEDVSATSSSQSAGYIAPKLGINFILSSNVLLGIEGKYNYQLTSESGTGDAFDSGYKTDVTKTYTIGASLTFLF